MPRAIRRVVGAVAIGALALTTSNCSSGPSAAARSLCAQVGRVLGAPPGRSVDFTMPAIAVIGSTGDSRLDVGARHLAAAIHRQSAQAVSKADSEIQTACVQLGIWQTYHRSS